MYNHIRHREWIDGLKKKNEIFEESGGIAWWGGAGVLSFNIKSLISTLTGGNSPNIVFENFLNSLVRDFEIDSRF